MDTLNESIRPRRALHTRVWPLHEYENCSGLISSMRHKEVTVMDLGNLHISNIPLTDEQIYSRVNTATFKVQQNEKNTENTKKNNINRKENNVLKKGIQYLEEYCEATTLHGLKYVGDTTLSFFERIYWLAMFIIGLCFAAYFIAQIYAKFETSPMVISFNPKLVLLNSFPFPALTICNVNLALKSMAEEIEANGSATSKLLLADLCNTQYGIHHKHKPKNTTDWETVEKFTIAVNQKCNDMMKVCKWGGETLPCDSLINSVLTDEGYCCSFNQLPLNMILRGVFQNTGSFPSHIINWNDEDGYGEEDNIFVYPYRSAGQGQNLGLTLVMDANLKEYYCTSTNSIGFKVLLSAPNERPKIAEIGHLMSPGTETRISIKPEIRDATEGVRSIPIEKRQCYFARERNLEFFYVYSEKNCKLECQSNFTMKMCKCVPYYLPRDPQDPICDKEQEICTMEAKSVIERFTSERLECKCLPSCHDITYKIDTMSFGKLESKYEIINMDILGNTTNEYFAENMAIAHFYFEADKFVKSTKSEMFGFTEFLSNTGGLLGLFLGFSFLSAMEIIYFIIFRFQFRYYREYKARQLQIKQKKKEQERWAHLPYTR